MVERDHFILMVYLVPLLNWNVDYLTVLPHVVLQLLSYLPMGKSVKVGLLWVIHIVLIHGV